MPKFRFDGEVILDGGLAHVFARSVATIDPAGDPVSSGSPRFDLPRMVVGVAPPALFDAGGATMYVLASGYDHDGTSPLLIVHHAGVADIYAYYGGGSTKHVTDGILVQAVNDNDRLNAIFLSGNEAPQRAAICHRRPPSATASSACGASQ